MKQGGHLVFSWNGIHVPCTNLSVWGSQSLVYFAVTQSQVQFEVALKAALRHFPHDFGLLSSRDDCRIYSPTAYENACEIFGAKNARAIIKRCVDDVSHLHHYNVL